MNYVLKMKDDMEVVNAAAERLHQGAEQLGGADEFTQSRRDFADHVMGGEEALQQSLFAENDKLLANMQWMPTLNLEPGLSKPKSVRLDADQLSEEATDKAAPSSAAHAVSRPTAEWASFEQAASALFASLDAEAGGGGVVSKASMRQVLLKRRAGGSLAATKAMVTKLWRRLEALYGKLTFTDVSLDEITLGVAACKGAPVDPRTVETPFLAHVDHMTSSSVGSGAKQLSFGVRVAFTEIFRRFDADADGALSKGELNAFQRSVHGGEIALPACLCDCCWCRSIAWFRLLF